MNDRTLSRHYEQFTPRERLRLSLAGLARGDEEEVVRLRESCPRRRLAVLDPQYSELLDCMEETIVGVLMCWLDVSHYVVRARLCADHFNLLALRCQAQLVDNLSRRSDSEQLEAIFRQYVAKKAEAEANCKMSSACWKGIESAIIRFCGEIDLTRDQLFAMLWSVPPVIEEARHALDADVPADRDQDEAVYRRLCQGWRAERNPSDNPFVSPAGMAPKVDEP